MKKYELTYLISPDLSGGEAKTLSQKVSGFIAKQGKLEKTEDPFKKKLAYPVKDKTEAFLSIIVFSFEPNQLSILENNLKSDPKIMRHIIIIKKEEKKISKRKLEKVLSKKPEKLFAISADKQEAEKETPITETKKVELKEIDQKIEEILKD